MDPSLPCRRPARRRVSTRRRTRPWPGSWRLARTLPCTIDALLLAGCALSVAPTATEPTASSPATPTTAPPDPLDAAAPTPPLRYRSTFADVRPIADEPPIPWRDANDTVGRIGGWRVYLREGAEQ